MFSPDGKLVLLAWDGPCNELLDVKSGKVVRTFPSTPYGMEGVAAFLPGNKLLLATTGSDVSGEREATGWDLGHAKKLQTIAPQDRYGLRSVGASSDGKLALTGHWEGHVKLWDLASGKLLRTLDEPQRRVSSRSIVTNLMFLPGNKRIVSA